MAAAPYDATSISGLSGATAFSAPSITSATGTSAQNAASREFNFPPYTTFPPFYTFQRNAELRARQLELWSSLILSYAAHHDLFRLSLSNPPADLFANNSIHRALKPGDIRTVLTHMALPASGAHIEWIHATARGEQSSACWVWFKTPGEWADLMYGWVDETGQKNSVLTVYELREGEAVTGKPWTKMDEMMLRRVLQVLVKRGKAQIFGQTEGEGVKFF